MQIRVNRGKQEIRLTKPELKKIEDVAEFMAAIPKGLFFEEERKLLENAAANFLVALEQPTKAWGEGFPSQDK